jgi:hypothetical protein
MRLDGYCEASKDLFEEVRLGGSLRFVLMWMLLGAFNTPRYHHRCRAVSSPP